MNIDQIKGNICHLPAKPAQDIPFFSIFTYLAFKVISKILNSSFFSFTELFAVCCCCFPCIIHLSKDIAVKLRTEAATVTIAMKLLKVQYVDPKTHFRSLIVTKLKLQFNDANIKSAKLILAMNALGTTHIERCAEKKKRIIFLNFGDSMLPMGLLKCWQSIVLLKSHAVTDK